VAAVVCALVDPDDRVRGRGIARLRSGGVAVTLGDGEQAAREQLAPYLVHRLTGRPLVTAKFAVSLDGRIATRTGDARWVSGPEARQRTRAERAGYDAILVGSGTALADDPHLTARDSEGRLLPCQPLRVVLDRRGRTPPSARLLDTAAPTLVVTSPDAPPAWRAALAAHGARLLDLPAGDDSLPALLTYLARVDVLSLLVEGGSAVHGAFFDGALVDRVQAVLAPVVIGGAGAPAAVGGLGAGRMGEAHRLARATVERVGADLILTGWLRRPPLVEPPA
jgi:diaminohydroxyphosphoribosylaminopyrimidine deaminase/5-amino-6-(5-phosphoribosylamino)uracil reductase